MEREQSNPIAWFVGMSDSDWTFPDYCLITLDLYRKCSGEE
jgi:hypothetical protein